MTTVDKLMAYDDKAFVAVVDADLRDQLSPTTAAALRDPRLAHRWLAALERAHASISGQLEANEAELAAKWAEGKLSHEEMEAEEARIARWKVGALRFKSGLEMTLAEARNVVRRTEFQALDSRVRTLEDALLHQQAVPGTKGQA